MYLILDLYCGKIFIIRIILTGIFQTTSLPYNSSIITPGFSQLPTLMENGRNEFYLKNTFNSFLSEACSRPSEQMHRQNSNVLVDTSCSNYSDFKGNNNKIALFWAVNLKVYLLSYTKILFFYLLILTPFSAI